MLILRNKKENIFKRNLIYFSQLHWKFLIPIRNSILFEENYGLITIDNAYG